MNLTDTTQSLELITSAAQSLDWSLDYTVIDKTSSTVITPASDDDNISTATTTTLLSAPSANIYYVIRGLTLRNKGSGANTVTLQKDVSGNNREIFKVTLAAGESVVVDEDGNFTVFNAFGIPKNATMLAPAASVLVNPLFATAGLTSTKTITSTNTFAVYVGKAPRALSSVALRARVTTAMATITWGEVAIAKGAISIGGDPTLTVVGYADVSAVFNSLGQKSVTITVSSGQSIDEGDDLWVLIGNQATTALQVRAQSIADDLQVGVQASAVVRPSTIVGTPTLFTLEGATILAAWVALVV